MSILNVLDLIHAVPEVEKRLVDNTSKIIYKIRMNYAVYRDIDNLRESVLNLNVDWHFPTVVEEMFVKYNPKRILIFGAGEWGRHTLNTLRHSKYKNLEVIFVDNNADSINKIGGGGM